MAYGFKLFELYATEGPRRTTRQNLGGGLFGTPNAWDWMQEHADTLELRDILTGQPNLNHPENWHEAEPVRGDSQLRFVSNRAHRPQHVFLTVRYGRHGEYASAMGRSVAEDVDLRTRAPDDAYRVLALFPPDGELARLAVETVGQRCPVNVVTSWLGRAAYEAADGGNWSRLRVKALTDRRRLLALARDAEEFEAIFTQTDPESPGGRSDEIVLRHKVKDTARRMDLLQEAVSWFDFSERGEGAGDYVARLEGIVGFDSDSLNDGGLHFDGAKVTAVHDGETKTFEPGRLNKAFIYEISQEIQASNEDWLRRVYSQLSGPLSAGTDIQL